MTSRWEEVSLSRIAKPVSRPVAVVPGQSFRTLGVKWWGEGAYERETIDGSRTAAKTLSIVRKGDLIINKIWVRNGSTAVVSDAVDGCAASGEFPTFELDRSLVMPEFLHWLSKSRGFWSKCDALSRGSSGKNRIKPDLFLTISVPLPPMVEQRRIVNSLSEIARKVEEAATLHDQILKQAEALKISLHLTAAQGRTVKLGDILALDEESVAVDPLGSYPQVGLRSFGGGLFPKEAVLGTETTYKRFNCLSSGALVLSQVKGWEGAIAVCPSALEGWFASPEYRTFKCRPNEVNPAYLDAIVPTEWFWKTLKDATRGAGARRERTRPEQFLELKMPWPTLEKQLQATVVLQRLKKLRFERNATHSQWEALLPAFLHRIFSAK